MNCPNCGHDNVADASTCAQCGATLAAAVPPAPPPPQAPMPPPAQPGQANPGSGQEVPDHMVWAIISTVGATIATILACCCIPLGLATGIPAIVFANKAKNLQVAGDIAGAQAAAATAKTWCIATTVFGAVAFVLWFLLLVLQLTGIISGAYLEEMMR